ncbi:Uncharacterised protein [BD1-7 clade bacterium]|uniref:Esterase n=1 Tax=BD1-7 clade bacterium TaxID=2029982 RepID=A0A5S9QJP5_9GAMM|nr:Uncharacterised protein [BD1-7 clade bacterium]CAA0119089.1 Uncharacterised protein [BD1-7 clade bacterium]
MTNKASIDKALQEKWSAEVDIEIPFHDVDLLAIAWHGHYVRYFEIARCALFDKMDYNYKQMEASGFAWPVIDLHVRYAQPSEFQQIIRVKATLVECEYRLKVKYLVTDAKTGKRLTKGHTVQVAVDMEKQEMCLASPKILFDKVGVPYAF